jgi:hypothetical protein
MRIPTDIVAARSRGVRRGRGKVDHTKDYFFTTSRWAAISYIASPENCLIVESGTCNPWDYFPPHVMRNVDYGINLGLDCTVTLFTFQDTGLEAGVLLELFSGEKVVGNYAYCGSSGSG